MRVVRVVLGNPPAEAQPDERVPHDEAEQAVTPARAENLVVPRVMADEAQLGEHHPQQRGDGEGRPRVAGVDEQGPPGEEGEDRQGDLPPVIARPAVEQALRPYLQRQRTKASRRGIVGNRRPVHGRGTGGLQGRKAGCCCCCHRRSVLPGASRANRSGLHRQGLEQQGRTYPARPHIFHDTPARRTSDATPAESGGLGLGGAAVAIRAPSCVAARRGRREGPPLRGLCPSPPAPSRTGSPPGRVPGGQCRAASLIFAPACLRLPLAWSARPSARRRRLPVRRPAILLALPLTASALCAIFLEILMVSCLQSELHMPVTEGSRVLSVLQPRCFPAPARLYI